MIENALLQARHRPGNPLRVTKGIRAFLEERLSEQERPWTASQLVEAIAGRFGVGATPEAIRQHLLAMGYRWKRTRYVPSRPPDPEEERKARNDLEELKGGERGRARPEVPKREQALFMPGHPCTPGLTQAQGLPHATPLLRLFGIVYALA